jgi:uncharacterized protein (TIGR02145 family)
MANLSATLGSRLVLCLGIAGCTSPAAELGTGAPFGPNSGRWTMTNLNLPVPGSYCYADEPSHCARYGRLYTWTAAVHGCRSLGAGWRLPSVDDWKALLHGYGGVQASGGSDGRAAFEQLLAAGRSGLQMRLGGGRDAQGYARLEAHGFYWTASEDSPGTALFLNLAQGKRALFLQDGGEKTHAFSVRCVIDPHQGQR